MPLSSDYRLPGVYTRESVGTRISTSASSRPTVAFVGPSIGYRTATQRTTMDGTEGRVLNYPGVVEGSETVQSTTSREFYEYGNDFTEEVNEDGATELKRVLTTNKKDKETVLSQEFTVYVAQPVFVVLDPTEGYVIPGTLKVKKKSEETVYTEDTDFTFDYMTGTFMLGIESTIKNDTTIEISYEKTTAEPVMLIGESAVTLSRNYVEQGSVTVISGKYTDGQEVEFGSTPNAADGYLENIDFIVDYDTGRISRTPDSRIPSFEMEKNNYFFVVYSSCPIKSGDSLIVTYHYIEDGFYDPRWCDTFTEVKTYFGEPFDLNSGVRTSDVSAAAYVAILNGMGGCYCIPVQGTHAGAGFTYPLTAWTDALDRLTYVSDIDVIVPLSGDPSVWQAVRTHINNMVDNEENRVTIVGADGVANGTYDSAALISLARQMDDENVWMVAPSTFLFRNPVTNTADVVPGWFGAAAVAGYLSSVPQYMPLTNKAVSGLYGANEQFPKSARASMSANGIIYINQTNTGVMRILHGRTTSLDTVNKQETNVVLSKYYILNSLRDTFDTGYVGSIITQETLLSVKSAAQTVLSRMQTNGFLTQYMNLIVEQDLVEPTQVNISFSYMPSYSLNYIDISFSIDSSAVFTV